MTIPFFAAGGVILDFFTPLGVADWVWYFIPLLLSVNAGGRSFTYVLAAGFSLLMVAGTFLSPPGIDFHMAFISRLMGVCVLWLMAFLISQRKEADEEVRKLSRAVDQSPASIVITGPAGNIEYVNPKFIQVSGYSSREVIGKNPRILKSGQTVNEDYQRLWKTIKAGGEWRGEFHNRRKNGELYWELASISPIFDATGRISHFLAVKEEITERKQAERDLAEILDFNRKIISEAPVGIVVFKATGQCVFANEAAARTLNATVPQVLKQDFRQLESWRIAGMLIMAEAALAARSPQQGEFHFTSTFGKEVWLVCHFSFFVRDNEPHLLLLFNDITPRKQAETALSQERSLLRTLIDNLPDCIYVKDTAGRKLLSNPADLKNLHCKTEAEAIGKTDFDHFPRNIAEGFSADDQKVFQGQPVINREEYFLNDDGEKRWLLTSKLPLRDQNGKITGLVGIGSDITDRRAAEKALRESQSLYYSLAEQLPVGVFRKDSEGRYVLVNPLFCRIKGMNAEDFLGKTPEEVGASVAAKQGATGPATKYAGTGAEHHERIMRTGKPIELVEEYVDADGRKRFLHVVKMPVNGPDGRIIGTQGIQFDITKLKQAEENVREQAALLDKAQDAIMVMSLDDRILHWNKSAERIYGWSADEVIGKNPVELYMGGTISPRHAVAIKAVKERGEWSGELHEITKNGKMVTVQGRCNLIRDDQGRPKSLLIINTDVTEKKKLEAQFLRSQRMESLGTLAGGIAHDLNNVLTPLLFAVQVLREKITDDDGKRLLTSLEVNVQRAAGLVKQVLAFGRGVEGERVIIHPKHIAREIKHIVNETFPKSVAFELHSAPNLWTVTGDPTQLHQILLNLCVNARDAMPNGGKLSLQLENVQLDEAYASHNLEARPGPHLCLTVNDTGSGIPKEIQERIFDPFFTTKQPGKGTGLGLSTTLAIVKSHGGFIHFYTEADKGSSFKVYLPANTAPAAAEKIEPEQAVLPHGHNKLVLVVDDEEPIRKIAKRTLERFGYRVLLAADGVEALSLYQPRQSEIDAVITDMVMPNMDGPETIAALKAINPKIKIVSSSGMAPEGYEAAATKAGVRHFIPKPYTAETMLLTLDDALNGES